jgi:hypothetical protein
MNPVKQIAFICMVLITFTACNSKPKPVSNNVTKTAVTVDGKKDSVINNPEKNYGNATVSEPCVKCLVAVIQSTAKYKMLTTSVPPQNIIYDVNWITSKKPVNVGDSVKIINGMAIDVNLKDGGSPKKLATFLYNNENARFYWINDQNQFESSLQIDSTSLKKIRNSCFWGVASAK